MVNVFGKNKFEGGSKYGAKTQQVSLLTELAGVKFSSKFEMMIGERLVVRQREGKISNLHFQIPVVMTLAKIKLIVDFGYTENGEEILHEAKGMETPAYRLKYRLYKCYGRLKLRITKGNKTKSTTEEVIPQALRVSHAAKCPFG